MKTIKLWEQSNKMIYIHSKFKVISGLITLRMFLKKETNRKALFTLRIMTIILLNTLEADAILKRILKDKMITLRET